MTTTEAPGLTGAAAAAADAARGHLLGLQSPEGWWKAELETNVTMDAEDLLLRQFLGIRTESETADAARWIRSQQRPDGTWANFHGGPADLSTTIEAYVALRPAGDPVDADHMLAAAKFARDAGGIEGSRVFTRIWLALFGRWSWDDLPVMPPELMFLPSRVPLNVYDWACWARQTIVPLTISSCCVPSGRCRSTWPNCAAASPRRTTPRAGGGRSTRSTASCTCTRRRRCGRCAGPRCAAPPTGSSRGRRPTAAGAGSSRRGCTR